MKEAEWILQEGRFYDKGCFIVQQSGEKARKSRLSAAGSRRVFGHSLFETCAELLGHSSSFAEVEEHAKRLDRFYIPTRYPNGLPGGLPFQSYSKKDLSESLDDLTQIFNACAAYLLLIGIDIS